MGKVLYDGKTIEFNDKYSQRLFKVKDLIDAKGLDGQVIYSSCFSCEEPDSPMFPEKMKGVKFYNCNLNNCLIPEGNEVIGGSQKRIIVQKDNEDWIVDESDKPVEPINKKFFIKLGLSTAPKDIPKTRIEGCLTTNKQDLIATVEQVGREA
jgi:hypothetical protein